MLIFYSIFFGVVQGLTEFLPISSSGHLVILHEFLKFNISDSLAFDVALHFGTLFALLFFFWPDVVKYFKAFLKSFSNWNLKGDTNQRISWLILLSTVPAAIAGFLLENAVETVFRSVNIVAAALVIGAVLFFIFEKVGKKIKELDKLNWKGAVLIGLAQVLALIPGVSRSGITIIAGLSINLKRQEAARFSFLMAIPIILGAGLKKFYDLANQGFNGMEWNIYLFGFLASLISGYFCVKYFLRYLKDHSLNIFGIYRILLAIIIIFLLAI